MTNPHDEQVYLTADRGELDLVIVTRAVRQKGRLWVDLGHTVDRDGFNSVEALVLDEDEVRKLHADLDRVLREHDSQIETHRNL